MISVCPQAVILTALHPLSAGEAFPYRVQLHFHCHICGGDDSQGKYLQSLHDMLC